MTYQQQSNLSQTAAKVQKINIKQKAKTVIIPHCNNNNVTYKIGEQNLTLSITVTITIDYETKQRTISGTTTAMKTKTMTILCTYFHMYH